MEKKIESYLHLYKGCPVLFGYESGEKREGTLEGVHHPFGAQVFDPKLVLQPYRPVNPDLIKLILRPLSDMTEEEKIEYIKLGATTEIFDIAHGKCEFGKIEIDKHNLTGESFSHKIEMIHNGKPSTWMGTTILYNFNSKQVLWLLSKGFDIFHLIESSLAINKLTLK